MSEVASIGGFVKQYQITVDPNRPRAYDIPLSRIRNAVQRSNNDVGGRVLEMSEAEFMVRGQGYIQGVDDVKRVALGVDESGTPILVQDVATVQIGPDIRRGLAELNGDGEVVGGIVVVRYGANVHDVVERVKARLAELQSGLPEGVEIVPVYDRTALIERSIDTLLEKLLEEMAIVALVCALFLLHVRSALVAVLTLPGVSITKAREILQQTDRILRTFPEVEHVFGKVGRADTATDPAPLSMIETTIKLKPEDAWRPGMTPERLTDEMNRAIRFPGVTNAWTMPIKTRIDMLSTGIRTPVGIKISGPDLTVLQEIGRDVEAVVRQVPGTRSAYSERVMGGNYLNFSVRRDEIARYGLTVGDVQNVIQSAIGGMNITTTVEGLERYPVNLRYSRDLRDSPAALRDILVQTPTRQQIPLGHLATMSFVKGPPVIKSEQARPNAWVYVDIEDVDVGTYVERARQAVAEQVEIPTGYSLGWSGQYEYMVRAQERLQLVVPVTLVLIFLTIYASTQSVARTLIVLSAVPLSLIGTFCLLYALDYNLSIAVWVGIIALAGLSAETGVVMLLYLDRACDAARAQGRLRTLAELRQAVFDGAARRVRPVVMLSATTALGLLPIMWSTGTGADVMKRIAAPMVGGVVTTAVVVLLVFPAVYCIWRGWGLSRQAGANASWTRRPRPGFQRLHKFLEIPNTKAVEAVLAAIKDAVQHVPVAKFQGADRRRVLLLAFYEKPDSRRHLWRQMLAGRPPTASREQPVPSPEFIALQRYDAEFREREVDTAAVQDALRDFPDLVESVADAPDWQRPALAAWRPCSETSATGMPCPTIVATPPRSRSLRSPPSSTTIDSSGGPPVVSIRSARISPRCSTTKPRRLHLTTARTSSASGKRSATR